MNEESLFAAALEKSDLPDRQKFIEEACGEGAALRRRIEKLLEAHDHALGVLERGPAEAPDGDGAGSTKTMGQHRRCEHGER